MSKADTLYNIKPLLQKAKIEELLIFTVKQWRNNRRHIIEGVVKKFGGRKIIVRSSSLSEDLSGHSNAGFYNSFLGIDSSNKKSIEKTVTRLISDYDKKDRNTGDNQVLIQRQTDNILLSGVVFTRNPKVNSPYYLVNYDDVTESTDSVTSGLVANKVEIIRNILPQDVPRKWKRLIEATWELEKIFPDMVLDIEFAITKNNKVVIFQVRPLTANRKYLAMQDKEVNKKIRELKRRYVNLSKNNKGRKFYLSDMAFWNPAEIIGDQPNCLDCSIYNRLLLEKNWNKGLVPLGYTKVAGSLMVLIGSKPYINITNAFLALCPEKLPKRLKKKLLEFYNRKLNENPHLHDKIEFDIVYNCFDFSFNTKCKELVDYGFSRSEVKILQKELISITNNVLGNFKKISELGLRDIEILRGRRERTLSNFAKCRSPRTALESACELLDDCKSYGTEQFARIARLAFIGKSLLGSLKAEDSANKKFYDEFFSSILTVATELDKSFTLLCGGKIDLKDFLKNYGHLRPGTYDITRLPYRKNREYFTHLKPPKARGIKIYNTQTYKKDLERARGRISDYCRKYRLDADGDDLLKFVKESIQMREYFKFEFTKNVSEALELIAYAGKKIGFTRNELSNLDIRTIRLALDKNIGDEELVHIWKDVILSRERSRALNARVSLPPLIFSTMDFTVVPTHAGSPNFITETSIMGEVADIDAYGMGRIPDLAGKIVVVEKADPGYDWIFTNKIGGLVTKYGGAASHMAIRCAEFNIPAAIGCGERLFLNIRAANKILLDCKKKRVEFM